MKIYSPSDIAKLLNVKESTLRKYSILLENVGYSFQRNNQNQRWYNDQDIIALQKLVTLKNNGDMSLQDSAHAVYLWVKGEDVSQELTVIDSDTERHNNDITEIKEMIHKQNELIEELVKKLDQQQTYIEDSLNKRDQLLMQSLKETMEVRKEIAAVQEKEENKKVSIWKRIFGS